MKTTNKIHVLFAFICSLIIFRPLPSKAQVTGRQILQYREDVNNFFLDGQLDISSDDLITNFPSVLNMDAADSLIFQGYTPDTDNYYVAIKYKQFHQGVPVDQVTVSFTEKDNRVHSIMGNLVKGITAAPSPSVTPDDALSVALAATPARTFLWQVPDEEENLQETENDPSATYYPKPGELVYAWTQGQQDGKTYVLAWRFVIDAYDPRETYEVFIDAQTGMWIKTNPLTFYCGQWATCNTLYNNTQDISTHHVGGASNHYELRDCASAWGEVETQWYNKHGLTFSVTNGNTTWGYSDQSATTSHWAGRQAMKYYWDVWGRNSIDNNGKKMTLKVDMPDQNASWSPSAQGSIMIGRRDDNGNTFGTIDIVGHEFTHGVTYNTAHLGSTYESGALNESFSDIMGTLIENYITGSTDWLAGGQAGTPFIRSLQHPSGYVISGYSQPQPDKYQGPGWEFSGIDQGGVHQNSSVQNYWFYKLANAIGIDKAGKITYRSLTNNINATSQYVNARQGSIAAAEMLYGRCSPEVYKTIHAWYEVGVGSDNNTDPYCVTITGTSSYCWSIVGTVVNYVYTASCPNVPANTNQWWSWSVPVGASTLSWHSSGNQLFVTEFLDHTSKTIQATAYFGQANPPVTRQFTIGFSPCLNPVVFPGQIQRVPGYITSAIRSIPADVNTAQSAEVNVYPNPAQSSVNVSLSNEEPTTLTLVDMQGQIIKHKLINGSNKIDITGVANGVYFLKIKSSSLNKTERIVVLH